MCSLHTDGRKEIFARNVTVGKTYLWNASDSVRILDFVTKPVALCDSDKNMYGLYFTLNTMQNVWNMII